MPAARAAPIAARVRGPELRVLPDQRTVEVAGERPHVPREVVGEDQPLPATDET